MRIACDSCNAAYDVPPERVPPGKGVKCARCGHVWVPVERVDGVPEMTPLPEPLRGKRPQGEPSGPVPPLSEHPPDMPAETVVVERPVREEASKPLIPALAARPVRRGPVLVGWVLSLAVLGALGWAAVHYRAPIVQAWPNAARAYTWIGLSG